MSYSNKIFGILGLGISGSASVKFMMEKGYQFISWDDSPESIKTGLNIKRPDDPMWAEVDYVIASPGIPNLASHIIVKNLKPGAEIICDVELFYMHFPNQKYVAITGTNGKSTTTKLIEHIFLCNEQKAIACGNIGVPVLSVVPQEDDIIVLELSSYQLELIKSFRPSIAVILNITPDHLDHHGSMEAYFEAKKRIFLNQTPEDYLILNLDDKLLQELYDSLMSPHIPSYIPTSVIPAQAGTQYKQQSQEGVTMDLYEELSFVLGPGLRRDDGRVGVNLIPVSVKKVLSKGISMIGSAIYDALNKEKIHLPKNKNLRGEHNSANIVAAYAATSIQTELMKGNFVNAIKTYPGLTHRLQFLGEADGIEFINDSKATNADSTETALNSLKGDAGIFLIAGGLPKEGGLNSIRESLKAVKYAFLIGKAQDEFAAVLGQIKVPYRLSNTLDIAFKDAMQIIKAVPKHQKKILLLSPACASFDQWKSFEKRGERFIQLVQEEIGNDIDL
jgi:UDP-N-acetylmuramoylalanine--D-glutamate ligase